MNYTIDATGKSLGRLATEVAVLLMGKNDVNYTRNNLSGNTVTVSNAGKLKVPGQKMIEKTYLSFSGYPGGLKKSSMAHVVEKKGYREVVMLAVKGMLPANKLRNEMMKSLTVTD
ncbi:50S ribosomal protein L13 [Patescibacteria group bacterium]|nr:50S ribosomal protein L13 [Patescibacteria group bacterium]